MNLFVAPTEPPALRALGKTSSLPERYGVDVLTASRVRGLCGIQRKEFKDFLASVDDGRLTRELNQMRELKTAVLLIEGRPRWSVDGGLLDRWRSGNRWTKTALRNYLRSVQDRGVWVEYTDDLVDTIASVRSFVDWCAKTNHKSSSTRPAFKGTWGTPDDREFAVWVLQSLTPGLGPTRAGAIFDAFGRLPLRWDVDAKEMLGVKGIGKVQVERLFKAVRGTDADS